MSAFPWWKFWNMRSEFVGGLIFGAMFMLCVMFLTWALLKFMV